MVDINLRFSFFFLDIYKFFITLLFFYLFSIFIAYIFLFLSMFYSLFAKSYIFYYDNVGPPYTSTVVVDEISNRNFLFQTKWQYFFFLTLFPRIYDKHEVNVFVFVQEKNCIIFSFP